MSMAALEAK